MGHSAPDQGNLGLRLAGVVFRQHRFPNPASRCAECWVYGRTLLAWNPFMVVWFGMEGVRRRDFAGGIAGAGVICLAYAILDVHGHFFPGGISFGVENTAVAQLLASGVLVLVMLGPGLHF